MDVALHEAELSVAERYGLPVHDGLIVAAVLQGGCDTLWTEDMQHDLVIDGRLTIRNPFLER